MATDQLSRRDLTRIDLLDRILALLEARLRPLHADEEEEYVRIASSLCTPPAEHADTAATANDDLTFAVRCPRALQEDRYAWMHHDDYSSWLDDIVSEYEGEELEAHSLAWLLDRSQAGALALSRSDVYEFRLWDAVHGTFARLRGLFDRRHGSRRAHELMEHVRRVLTSVTSSVSVMYQAELEPELRLRGVRDAKGV